MLAHASLYRGHRFPRAVIAHAVRLYLRFALSFRDVEELPTRLRERVMRRFRSAVSAQRFLEAVARVGNLFRPGRHRLTAAAYRATMWERRASWREVAGLRAA
jgi:transposase-like protein